MTDPSADAPTEPAPLVRHERTDDGVDVVTLQHGKVNALSVEVLAELRSVVGELAAAGARAVVVSGGPKVFAAGADITQFAERGGEEPFEIAPSDRVAEIGAGFLHALNDLAALPCPTIAAIDGVALGGGCELALACDFRVASTRARFGQPEILLGIIPGGGGTQRLARLVGPARAKDLVFTGRTIDAEEALAIGLVDAVAPEDALSLALERAGAFARGPREALALAKVAVDGGLEGSLDEGLVLEQRRFVDSFGTADAQVGVRSFLRDGPGKAEFA
ncbi:enoyl-CoA hydratase/isomerase family protein [Dermatobacter hominis]|uniref:enoyl-CoA hydratase/isomerase family protein n=1 Tax=Dermatobacter hominis TaxID=2884263 RepID=UPI001D101240|nr:enoyl-CoA hydratase/isomerase family protein [Dermatobacter hominis]UDY37155.1 enoyl-CoA hydratase/isomerase family protein [Dermatobacter hominis]